MTELSGFSIPLAPYIVYPVLVVLFILGGLLINLLLKKYLSSLAQKTRTDIDDKIILYLKRVLKPFIAIGVLFLIENAIPLSPNVADIINKILLTLSLLTLFYFIWKLIFLLLSKFLISHDALGGLSGTIIKISKFILVAIALVIVLENLGVSLKAVWTTLGVGSIAIALALQDTLSNLFSGLYILADRPIRKGDYISLDSGEEGFVKQVGWRSTTIDMASDNSVVIPNRKLADAIITNYNMPKDTSWINIPVGVSYNDDPEKVEAIVREETDRIIKEDDALIPHQDYQFRFEPGFGSSSLDFTLRVQLKRYTDRFNIKTKIRKALFKKFKAAGIEIPFPQTDVHIKNQK